MKKNYKKLIKGTTYRNEIKKIEKPLNYNKFASALLIIDIIIIASLLNLNIIPLKYLVIIFIMIISLSISLILIVKNYINKDKISALIIAVYGIVSLIGLNYIRSTNIFLRKITTNNQETLETYYLLVLKNAKVENVKDLENKTIGLYQENTKLYEHATSELLDDISFKNFDNSSIENLLNNLLKHNTDAILISSFHKNNVTDQNIFKKMKVIKTYKVKTINKKIEVKENYQKTFNVLISGIDTYGDISLRSRSDVNMVATINIKNHEILLTSIPRDYYVQLYETTGIKDKLTHAGLYGVDKSLKTISTLLNTNIDYYVRVNFNSLVNVVDLIGGIDVYSDQTIWTNNKNTTIYNGWNHMSGTTALRYARERHSYSDGDRHRVRNQQDVIEAITKKITTQESLIMKYNSLLKSTSSSIQTNMKTDLIKSIAKEQISLMPTWKIAKYSLNGYDSSNYTYSFGSQLLYVMEPDYHTVDTASIYINSMIKGDSIDEIMS